MFFSKAEESKVTDEEEESLSVEEQFVTDFIEYSSDFKKMKAIAERQQNNAEFKDLVDLVKTLENTKSFYEIERLTSHWDIPNNDNIIVYNLGRNKMNAILFFSGFFSDRGNFFYYALHFREAAQKYSQPGHAHPRYS